MSRNKFDYVLLNHRDYKYDVTIIKLTFEIHLLLNRIKSINWFHLNSLKEI